MTTRRAILQGAAFAGATGFLGGLVSGGGPGDAYDRLFRQGVSLTITTLAADVDGRATAIAQRLAANLERVGIDTNVVLKDRRWLSRGVLADDDFDIYVARHPGYHDPDGLRSLLSSSFVDGRGWQNPFGYRDSAVDESLSRQHRATNGTIRHVAAADVQNTIARTQPFTPIARPLQVHVVSPDRFEGWWRTVGDSSLRHLGLDRRSTAESPVTTAVGAEATDPDHLELVTTDDRITRSLNPLATTGPDEQGLLSLVYEPLGRRYQVASESGGRSIRPWLASSWEWTPGADRPVAEVTLREDARWHDGRPVTAADVAFTYRFLADTSLGRAEDPIPAATFAGRVSSVTDVSVVDDRRVRVSFQPGNRPAAERAFTVSILPAHVWREQAERGIADGPEERPATTHALQWPNTSDPVGSGPLRVESVDPRSEIRFRRFEDHFLAAGASPTGRPEVDSGPDFERLTVRLAPADETAVDMVVDGDADAVTSAVEPGAVSSVGGAASAMLQVSQTRAFYHVGYNCRREPLDDARFRRAIAALVDEATLVEEVFDGYALPIASPLAGTTWLPRTLEWTTGDPAVEFAGEDGSLDVAAARAAFAEAGAEFTDAGTLRMP